nr:S-layer homology domain-containing protein [Veillonella denticariosi]
MKRKQMALSLAIVLALGTGTVFGAEKEMSGASLNASTDATYDNKVSVTKVDGPGNVAVGQQNIVTSQYGSSGAFGNQNYVNGKDSDAFGEGNDVYGTLTSVDETGDNPAVTKNGDGQAMAFGDNNAVYGAQVSGYGSNNIVGEFKQHPKHGKYDVEDKLPVKSADYSSAFGTGNTITADHGLAAGFNNKVSGSYSTALGQLSVASGERSVAVGYSTKAQAGAVAIGNNADAGAVNAVTVGTGSKISAQGGAIGIGSGNTVSGKDSGAFGVRNTIAQANTYVLGGNVTTTQENSVVLGNASADRAATTETSAIVNGITYSGFAGQGSAANGVVSAGAAGKERQLINVAAGKVSSDSTDAVNGSQLYAVADTVGHIAGSVKNILGGNATVGSDGTITMSNIGETGASTVHDAIKSAYDKEASVKAGSSNITVTNSNRNATGGTEYVVDVSKNLSVDSVTTGGTVINNGGVTVGGNTYVTGDGLNANNQKITNVGAGDISPTSTDAINGSQLYQATNGISSNMDRLNHKIGKVGAGAAALAAIHPLDFDPDDKWNFAAGYGNYAGENAMALGAFYRPNEDTMFSVAGSMGNGENMVNAGVTVKLGQKNGVSTSRVALAKEVQDLKAIVKAQNAEIQQMKGAMGMAPQHEMKDVNFPDVPANHWAYEYVKSLADRGLVEGYPDGEFKGDRALTRYEYAAIIYRALQLGGTY